MTEVSFFGYQFSRRNFLNKKDFSDISAASFFDWYLGWQRTAMLSAGSFIGVGAVWVVPVVVRGSFFACRDRFFAIPDVVRLCLRGGVPPCWICAISDYSDGPLWSKSKTALSCPTVVVGWVVLRFLSEYWDAFSRGGFGRLLYGRLLPGIPLGKWLKENWKKWG